MEFKRILIPMDFTPSSLVAFDAAIEHLKPAQIYLLNVLDVDVNDAVFGMPVDQGLETRQHDLAYEKLSSLVKSTPAKDWDVEIMVSYGSPVHEILDVAKNNEIDLIIMGSHGSHNFAKDIFGHHAQHVSRKAECSTWIIKTHPTAKETGVPQKVANG